MVSSTGAKDSPQMGTVLPFRRPKKRNVITEDMPNAISKEGCLVSIGLLAPVPKELGAVLNLPETLYRVGEDSFSSDPLEGIGRMSDSAARGGGVSAEMLFGSPDYALHISYRGNSVFCSLLDKKRRIFVMGSLGNMLGQLYWDEFIGAVGSALNDVARNDSEGTRFDILAKLERGTEMFRLE